MWILRNAWIRFLETTKGVHKFINIFISKRRFMGQLPVTDNLATCVNVNGRNRGQDFVASRVWYDTLGFKWSEDYCLFGQDIMSLDTRYFMLPSRCSWGIEAWKWTRTRVVFLERFENLTDTLSRNMCKQLPIDATQHLWISRPLVSKFLKRKATDSRINSVHTWCLHGVTSQKRVTFRYYIHTCRWFGGEFASCNEFSELLGPRYSDQNN